MSTEVFPKGAEWRKWDLHVHTPSSVYQNYGKDDSETWERFISDLESLPAEFSVIGINDYLFIDGYERLLHEQINNDRLKNVKLLPVVEFRIEKFAGVQFGSFKRINLHVIFSDEISVETIKSQFLNTLEQSYTLECGENWTRAITKNSLEELGASIKSAVPKDQLSRFGTDLLEGFNNLNVKEEQIFKSLEKDCFKGKYFIAIGKTEWAELKWSDSSIASKKSIINRADIVFTAIDSVDAFFKSKSQLSQQCVNDFLLDCSDAHYFSDSKDKDRIGNCYTWIKGDPSFEGLKQALNEPEDRVFVGSRPPLFDRVDQNRTKYIKGLRITSVEGYDDNNNVWFDDVFIPFNSELVAIIGNKGSGKSAIADIISLCSNYYEGADFSFLTPQKFRSKNGKLAKNFEATLTWESEYEDHKNLNDSPLETEVLEVKYLPQGRFERLTNEISTAVEFQNEIESVVFSHVPDTEKLGAQNFEELVKKKTENVSYEIQGLIYDVVDLNEEILALEGKDTETYRLQVLSKLAKKEEELNSLLEPESVSDPNQDPEKKKKSEQVNKKIIKIKQDIEFVEAELKKIEGHKKQALEKRQNLSDVKSMVRQKESEVFELKGEISEKLEDVDFDLDQLIEFKVDFSSLNKAIEKNDNNLYEAQMKLGEIEDPSVKGGSESLYVKLHESRNELDLEKGKLDAEQQAYQKYLSEKETWVKAKNSIIGDSQTPNTIEFFKTELSYLKEKLPLELEKKYNERREVSGKVFDKKYEVIEVYKAIQNKLNEIIDRNSETLGEYRIKVDASLVKSSSFNTKILSYISQNKLGSFHSKEGAEKTLNSLISDVDFDDKNSVIYFLDSLVDCLKFDVRSGQNRERREIGNQVKDILGLYDYLFSLRFLDNNYKLKQGDKDIEQLSPGERGALLLVFYLLLDKNDIPLIIDQPEDNLDNHSVATVLVPFIRAAKAKRQIIMVTHNPNLAVVSDAEQVISVDLDKQNGYKFSVVSGSIENRDVNLRIVEVLEGAMPAFNTRKRKYYE